MKTAVFTLTLFISLGAFGQDVKAINTSTAAVSGTTLLYGSNGPLYVIDGLIKHNRDSTENRKLFLDLNPDKIENINVLKGETATTLYGEEGKNGVIVITTKEFARKSKIEKK
jgi:TonB-dependent SusC/RagA subfamily outer membrane receptor